MIDTIGVIERRGAEAGRRGRARRRSRPAAPSRSIVGFGQKAVPRLASLVGDSRWFVQRRGARLLGRIGTRRGGAAAAAAAAAERSARRARSGRGARRDPGPGGGARDPHRAARGDRRGAPRGRSTRWSPSSDPRVVPMLVRILEESEPLGKDHEVVLETIDALGDRRHRRRDADRWSTMAQRKKFFGGRKLRALKERSVDALARVKTAKAAARAQGRGRRRGDGMLQEAGQRRGSVADGSEEGRGPGPAAGRGAARHRAVLAGAPAGAARHRRARPRRRPSALQSAPSIVIGFIGDEVVVDGTRLPRGTASLVGFARDLRERGIEKITLTRGLSRAEVGAPRRRPSPTARRRCRCPTGCSANGVRNVTLGRIVVDEVERRSGRHRRGAARLRHGGRDRRERCGTRRRPAISRTRARRARSSTAWRGW